MSRIQDFCAAWTFVEGFEEEWARARQSGETVELPHTAVELPFDYFDERCYQRQFTYQKNLVCPPDMEDKEVSLVFDGAMADAKVFVNGALVANHPDGYTPFEARLTDHLTSGDNLITVSIDGTENPDLPPFGGQIDYLTYAGIYREVWLKVTDSVSIANIRIETQHVLQQEKTVVVECDIANPKNLALEGRWRVDLLAPDGSIVKTQETDLAGPRTRIEFQQLEDIALWTLEEPTLYRLKVALHTASCKDEVTNTFGFRTAEFSPDGFRLNGEKLKLIGLNRHQSFPYSGYAQGRASQEKDAEILKEELACNIVRTSHYPQSSWFLDHCDRIGLLVLEEIPGWQHIGGAKWQDEAVENVRRMIERDWNHPSIILWGVRINESPDDDAFYRRTNALARDLDPTRQTGGVRKHTNSSLLEDVYTFNDFVLGEFELPFSNRPRLPLRDQNEVTGLAKNVPYLVTEYNGHMFPTKVFDQEQRQAEHVTRHLDILNAAYGDDSIAGCIGWCMFDYNTHNDFGSGDRVCHHGVMTMFREPKFAAFAYASQGDPDRRVVLEPVTFWARGERNIGGTLPLIILSNCDQVRLNFPSGAHADVFPDKNTYPHLPHPPIIVRHEHLPESELGSWGTKWYDIEIIGYLGSREVARRNYVSNPVADRLQLSPDRSELTAAQNETRVVIRALDQVGNLLPFIDAPINIQLSGPATLIGPTCPSLRGGATAFWIKRTGNTGAISVRVSSTRFEDSEIQIVAS
ncbi:MAG: glycoside hydrolase family 2 TIM barrel-domain containing protein [Stappiaceae bacterium]